MLVERGACSFADKAATLQAANVSLAIVYNNAPGASQRGAAGTAEAARASSLQPAALAGMSERVLLH